MPVNSANTLYAGIGEFVCSNNADAQLVASNLGSCLGIIAYDQSQKIGGMVHCLLPLSKSDEARAKEKPGMYVDTGFVLLLTELTNKGCKKSDLKIFVAGGSQINDEQGVFEIGKRNYTVLRKIIWKNNMLIAAEDIGGSIPRTLTLSINSGAVTVKSPEGIKQLT
jgi:chemotaxis protein CheD